MPKFPKSWEKAKARKEKLKSGTTPKKGSASKHLAKLKASPFKRSKVACAGGHTGSIQSPMKNMKY